MTRSQPSGRQHDQVLPAAGDDADRSVFAVRLDGDLDVAALRAALPPAALGLGIDPSAGQPGVAVRLTDLSQLDGQRHAALRRVAASLVSSGSQAGGPGVRATLFQLGAGEWTLVVTADSGVANAASWAPFAQALSRGYLGQPPGAPAWGPAPPAPTASRGYWAGALAGARPTVVLPADRGRVQHSGETAAVALTLTPAHAQAVQGLVAVAAAQPSSVLVAAFGALLMRYAGGGDWDVLLGWSTYGPPGLLPLRLRARGDLPFTRFVAETEAVMTAGRAHAGLATELTAELGRLLHAAEDGPQTALAAGVSVGPMASRHLRLPGVRVSDYPAVTAPSRRELDLQIGTDGAEISAALNYSTEIFDRASVERVASHLRALLAAAYAEPHQPLSRLVIMPPTERDIVLLADNDTAAPVPEAAGIADLFEEQARHQPQARAVLTDQRSVTYAELDASANRLARHLQASGVGREDVVGVLVDREADAVVAFLGVLKSGGVYLPLDDQYPAQRLTFIARQAGMRALVTHRGLERRFECPPDVTVVRLDEDRDAVAGLPAGPPPRHLSPDNLAYLIYTSGSTGQPKGVSIAHRSAANLAADLRRSFGLSAGDTVAMFASFGFDASVWEMTMALTSGAALAIVDPRAQTPDEVAALMTGHGVTSATLPPAFLRTLAGGELPTVRLLVSAGEACTPGLNRTWSVGRTFVNAYGPTEATVCATMARCTGREAVVPIGRPLANARVHVLDDQLQPVPLGIPGQLHISGAGLARGYRGEPARTAEAFVPDPFGPPGSRLYRTGDVARRTAGGQLHFVGRMDQQVKIRGHRVELAEVESVIARHRDVRDVILAVEDPPGQDARLVAYVVLTAEAHGVANRGAGQLRWQGQSLQRELHEFAANALPGYMLPARYVTLPAIPVTAHGKVDREALPTAAPLLDGPEHRPAESLTATERAVAATWAKYLGLEHLSRDDHFLEIGGHSLVAVQVIAEVREHFAVDLPIRALFDNPVLADFATAVDAIRAPA